MENVNFKMLIKCICNLEKKRNTILYCTEKQNKQITKQNTCNL